MAGTISLTTLVQAIKILNDKGVTTRGLKNIFALYYKQQTQASQSVNLYSRLQAIVKHAPIIGDKIATLESLGMTRQMAIDFISSAPLTLEMTNEQLKQKLQTLSSVDVALFDMDALINK